MQIHDLQVSKPERKQRVGRGGKRGTYSGRGMKGQKSRAGHRIRPALRDAIKKIPKIRGYRTRRFQQKPATIRIGTISKHFVNGEEVNPKTLAARGVIRAPATKHGVKILDGGELDKKLTFSGCTYSQGARTRISDAGGHISDK